MKTTLEKMCQTLRPAMIEVFGSSWCSRLARTCELSSVAAETKSVRFGGGKFGAAAARNEAAEICGGKQ